MINKLELLIKRAFILLNGPPSGYTGTRKFFKAALISVFGVSYYKHVTRIRMNKNISSTGISKITNNANYAFYKVFDFLTEQLVTHFLLFAQFKLRMAQKVLLHNH